jgi:hypothetical protein
VPPLALSQLGISDETTDGAAQRPSVARWDQERAIPVADVFGDAVHVRGHDGHAGLQRLDQ